MHGHTFLLPPIIILLATLTTFTFVAVLPSPHLASHLSTSRADVGTFTPFFGHLDINVAQPMTLTKKLMTVHESNRPGKEANKNGRTVAGRWLVTGLKGKVASLPSFPSSVSLFPFFISLFSPYCSSPLSSCLPALWSVRACCSHSFLFTSSSSKSPSTCMSRILCHCFAHLASLPSSWDSRFLVP
ncbi:hypothetical protein CPC08DRAFT_243289 [Agrocybe pediades]|nr:hypothetical protein CPC08DRAFT_243289 [Agrocybe pediades]